MHIVTFVLLSDEELLARLVAYPSVSGTGTREIADFLADYVSGHGTRVHRDTPRGDSERVNLILVKGPVGVPAGPGLLLSGHMDVVPPGDAAWSSPPFALTPDGDRLVGRGAADMKGFVALATNVFAATDSSALRAPLMLVFTYDEELGTLGAADLVRRGGPPEPPPRAAVIGEPTRLLPVRVHKGHVKLRVIVHGESAHSGYAHLGTSAIEPAARAVLDLCAIGRELGRERLPAARFFPDAPYAALNIGLIRGGTAVNVVPDRCTIDLGVRTLPGQDVPALVSRIRRTVAGSLAGVSHDFQEAGASPPLATPADAHVVALLDAALRATAGADEGPLGGVPGATTDAEGGHRTASSADDTARTATDASAADAGEKGAGVADAGVADLGVADLGVADAGVADAGVADLGVSYATDAGWLAQLGLECVVWGPGDIAVAHKPDEYVARSDLARARVVLESLVQTACQVKP